MSHLAWEDKLSGGGGTRCALAHGAGVIALVVQAVRRTHTGVVCQGTCPLSLAATSSPTVGTNHVVGAHRLTERTFFALWTS